MDRSEASMSAPETAGKPLLLIVEDDEDIRTQMRWGLAQDYRVLLSEDRVDALAAFRSERPALVTLDLGLPPSPLDADEGLRTLSEILEEAPATKIIIITGREERAHALEAIGRGAYDLFPKPIQMDELKVTLRRALHVHRLEREHAELQRKAAEHSFERMLGTSARMQEIFSIIRKVATTDAPVLIVGESGTGKELVAQAIHRQSRRSENPLVVINCGAIPENLLESELFGHEKGAFTGAHVQRRGRIEGAHRGSLFLDEIGELPLPLQVKLLRFLQENVIERVGGRETIPVDARVIAATHVDLMQAAREGRFREDLYYRLKVVTVPLPALRDRGGDVLLLARALLQRYADEYKKRITGFNTRSQRAIEAHEWPGNVRELENRIRRAVIMAEGQLITPADLELSDLSTRREGGLREARQALERELVVNTLQRNRWNITRTASELGISRPTLYELLDRLGIKKES